MKVWRMPWAGGVLELGARTLIMGILNVTPDSFSDGGRFHDPGAAVEHAWRMQEEGADILDVGGESTRPQHVAVAAGEEQRRVLPVIRRLVAERYPLPISIDTTKAVVAAQAIAAGAAILNDVWGLQRDPELARVAARGRVPTVVMHNQTHTRYADLMGDIAAYLRRSIEIAAAAGLPADLIMIDPGIGFGKTAIQNLDVQRDLRALCALGCPILVGTSRKSHIGKVLGGLPVAERLEGTAATVALCIANGADIVRVHDVKAMKRVAAVADAIVRPGRGGWQPE